MQSIIVIWNFIKPFDKEEIEFDEEKYKWFNVKKSTNKKLLIVKMMAREEKPLDIIDFVKNKRAKIYGDILIFIHNKPEISNLHEELGEDYQLFGNVEGKVYDILDVSTRTLNANAFENQELKEEIFDELWNEYNFKKKIEKIKHKTINYWLPLAIDIQGLSEVEESKRKDYLTDIYNSDNKNHDYFKQLLVDFWNMMVDQKFITEKGAFKKVNDSKNEESLQNILKKSQIEINDYFKSEDDQRIDIGLNQDMKNINAKSLFIKFIIKMDEVYSNIDEIDDLFSNYISESKRSFFFPLWLQEFAKKLDEIRTSI